MSKKQIVEWYYAHEADLTLGEVKMSKTAKIILIVLCCFLVALITLGIYFKHEIYDYIVNPTIVLTQKEVVIPVHGTFDPKEYVINDGDVEVEYPDISVIDFSDIGEYTLTYVSRNSMHESSFELKLVIVDDEPPVIELTGQVVVVTRGEETENFDPKKYIKDCHDNHTKKEDLIIDHTKSVDWNKERVEFDYVVTDNVGLKGYAKLTVVVKDHIHEHNWDDGTITKEPTYTETGIRVYHCDGCEETKEELIPILPHNHKYDDGTVIKESTTKKEGTMRYTCSICGETQDVPIPKKPEQESKPTEESKTTEGSKPPSHTHTWNKGKVVKEATTSESGIRRYTCTGCGATYDESIAKLPKSTEDKKPYIKGVKDITVKVGTDFNTFVKKLTSGVQGSGYVTVDFSKVNLTVPGKYKVTFSSDDGVTKTCTVTVTK